MNLKEYLFYEKISITDMAKELMISRNYLSEISLGKRVPSKRLAKAIEIYTKGKVLAESLLSRKDENVEDNIGK